jgi:hypothetical protein
MMKSSKVNPTSGGRETRLPFLCTETCKRFTCNEEKSTKSGPLTLKHGNALTAAKEYSMTECTLPFNMTPGTLPELALTIINLQLSCTVQQCYALGGRGVDPALDRLLAAYVEMVERWLLSYDHRGGEENPHAR